MNSIYFAYGSNMERGPMRERCPFAVVLGRARLEGWQFRINQRGFATVVPSAGSVVHGLLWRIDSQDEAALDDYEAVGEGLYRKSFLEVWTGSNPPQQAMVYLATHSEPGGPLPGYLEAIVDAAELLEFPEAYLAELRGWLKLPPPRSA